MKTFPLLLLFLAMPAWATNPYLGTQITGVNSPAIGADKSTYTSVIDTAMEKIDLHDHTGGSPSKGKQIPTAGLTDLSVTTGKLAAGAVTAAKLGTGSVTSAKILDGDIVAADLAAGAVTIDKKASMGAVSNSVAAGGFARSTSTGSLLTSSTASVADITNLTVTIITKGRPVWVGFQSDTALPTITTVSGFGVGSRIAASITVSNDGAACVFTLLRGATQIAGYDLYNAYDAAATSWLVQVPSSVIQVLDPVVAGTYTYKAQWAALSNAKCQITYTQLVAYEI